MEDFVRTHLLQLASCAHIVLLTRYEVGGTRYDTRLERRNLTKTKKLQPPHGGLRRPLDEGMTRDFVSRVHTP